MTPTTLARAAGRAARRANLAFGADVHRLRLDAGVPRTKLAEAAGIDQSYLARIESGSADASSEVRCRLAVALGADFTSRLYPNTGPTIRDRHQAPIVEALLSILHPRWAPFLEVAVRRPSRGWIDVGLHASAQGTFVATEVQSELRRLEQLLRWSEAKSDSIPSWEGFVHLGTPITVSRLLLVRDTRDNRSVARDFRRVLQTAFPALPDAALESLTAAEPWPGPALLWAARDRSPDGRYRIVARPGSRTG